MSAAEGQAHPVADQDLRDIGSNHLLWDQDECAHHQRVNRDRRPNGDRRAPAPAIAALRPTMCRMHCQYRHRILHPYPERLCDRRNLMLHHI